PVHPGGPRPTGLAAAVTPRRLTALLIPSVLPPPPCPGGGVFWARRAALRAYRARRGAAPPAWRWLPGRGRRGGTPRPGRCRGPAGGPPGPGRRRAAAP